MKTIGHYKIEKDGTFVTGIHLDTGETIEFECIRIEPDETNTTIFPIAVDKDGNKYELVKID